MIESFPWIQINRQLFSKGAQKPHGFGHASQAQQHSKKFFGPYVSFSVFYIDLIRIILSRIQLKISQKLNYISAPHFHRRTRFMSNKYTMNPF